VKQQANRSRGATTIFVRGEDAELLRQVRAELARRSGCDVSQAAVVRAALRDLRDKLAPAGSWERIVSVAERAAEEVTS
jgi:hypothetical protein